MLTLDEFRQMTFEERQEYAIAETCEQLGIERKYICGYYEDVVDRPAAIIGHPDIRLICAYLFMESKGIVFRLVMNNGTYECTLPGHFHLEQDSLIMLLAELTRLTTYAKECISAAEKFYQANSVGPVLPQPITEAILAQILSIP